jgi:hypothetical protein
MRRTLAVWADKHFPRIVVMVLVLFILLIGRPIVHRLVIGPTRPLKPASSSTALTRSTDAAAISNRQLPAGVLQSESAPKARLVESYGRLPLSFEINQGQTDSKVKFLSRGRGYTLFLTGQEAVLSLRSQKPEFRSQNRKSKVENREPTTPFSLLARLADPGPLATGAFSSSIDNLQSAIINPRAPNPESRIPAVLHMKLVGANPKAKVVGVDELPGKSNYFIGNDPAKWHTNVSNYAKVKYQGIYPGIDLVYYGNQRQLEYDFIVAPGADPRAIVLSVEGAEKVGIDGAGNLVMGAAEGDIRLHRPIVYQPRTESGPRTTRNLQSSIDNRQFLNGRYVLAENNHFALEIDAYDRGRPLIIDPVLEYSTYLGGLQPDAGTRIAVDANSNAYVVGVTYSSDFPIGSSPLRTGDLDGRCVFEGESGPELVRCGDVFITKLNSAGSAIVYSTYLGGFSTDLASAVAVDTSGSAYLTGYTDSPDFPTTPGAIMAGPRRYAGGDAFVARLDSTGSSLLYSTLLGGKGEDVATDLAIDSEGYAYVAGGTESDDFPTTPGAFDTTLNVATPYDEMDGFVAKVNPTGTALVYSTYLGGSNLDGIAGIAVDSGGSAYVTGGTVSLNFPTLNAFQPDHAGGSCAHHEEYPCIDGFVTKLSADGSSLEYSTYLGGTGDDGGSAIAVDSGGNAYVTGMTNSRDFPTTNGALQSTVGGGVCGDSGLFFDCPDAFVTKLNSSGTGLVYSTYLGGNNVDIAFDIAVDTSSRAFLTGVTLSSDFLTASPIQGTFHSHACNVDIVGVTYNFQCPDAFVTQLNSTGSALYFSSFLGGSDIDLGAGLAIGSSGKAYVTGVTLSGDFQTVNPLQGFGGAGPLFSFLTQISGLGADGFVARIGGLGSPAAVTLSPGSLDLGDHMLATTSPSETVTLRNNGGSSFNITSISTTGDFARTSSCGASLAASASCAIQVTFSPTAVGVRSGTLTVATSAGAGKVRLSGRGVTAASVGLSTPNLAFPDTPVRSFSPSQAVVISNNGTEALGVQSVQTTGDFGQTNNCPASLAVAANCSIDVTFGPTVKGPRTGSLLIAHDAAGSPSVITLAGDGIAPALEIYPYPPVMDFGNQGLGGTTSGPFAYIYNAGSTPVTLLSIVATGDFAYTSSCSLSPATLAAGDSCGVDVTFTPTALGPRQGTLTILSSAPGSPHQIKLSGKGVTLRLSPSSLNFWEKQGLGSSSAPQTVTLQNLGSSTVTLSSIQTTGDFSRTHNCPSSLVPTTTCTISVTFTPTVTGVRKGTLSVNSNAPDSPQVVSLEGTGVILSVSPDYLYFSEQGLGSTSPPQTITVTNIGPSTVNLTDIEATGDFDQTNNCPSSLSVAASCTISVAFTPTFLGSWKGLIIVTSDATDSPHLANLYGQGNSLSLTPNYVSFPDQAVGTTSSAQGITMTNIGTTTVMIAGIMASGDFAKRNICPASLAPAASCGISATFTPTAPWARYGYITITSDAVEGPRYVSLSGNGVGPAVALSPPASSFASRLVGTTSPSLGVILSNSGNALLTISAIAISGGNSADFSRAHNCPLSPSTLAAGADCTVDVTFTPSDSGPRKASLLVTSNAVGNPHRAILTGIGAALSPAPSSWNFGSRQVGTTSPAKAITLTNLGSTAIHVWNSAVTGTNSGDFSRVNSCPVPPATLAGGASCTISVQFTPAGIGARTAALMISHDGGASPSAVALAGTGTAAAASPAPRSGSSRTASPRSADGSGSGRGAMNSQSPRRLRPTAPDRH